MKRSGCESQDKSGRSDASSQLSDAVKDKADWSDDPGQEQGQANIWVEKSSSDPEEQPRGYEKAEAETEGDVQQPHRR